MNGVCYRQIPREWREIAENANQPEIHANDNRLKVRQTICSVYQFFIQSQFFAEKMKKTGDRNISKIPEFLYFLTL